MKLERLKVQNVRGLRDLDLDLGGNNIAVWGPNGSGKSCVVDAIEFLFTGRISRLMGSGTVGINLTKHGPHIDQAPGSAVVTAIVNMDDGLGSVEIERRLDEPEVLSCPEEVKSHVQLMSDLMLRGGAVLTRRDILRFVTAEAGTRAKEIQEILNLRAVEDVRKSLVRANNTLKERRRSATQAVERQKAQVNVFLDEDIYSVENLTIKVNAAREVLGGRKLNTVDSGNLKDEVYAPTVYELDENGLNPDLITRVTQNVRQYTKDDIESKLAIKHSTLRSNIAVLTADSELHAELHQLELTQSAIKFVDSETEECPVCGATWPPGRLENHLTEKIAAGKRAEVIKQRVTEAAGAIKKHAQNLRAQVNSLIEDLGKAKVGIAENDLVKLKTWRTHLDGLIEALNDPLDSYVEECFSATTVPRLFAPETLTDILKRIETGVKGATPKPTPEQTAWDVLTGLEVSVRTLEGLQSEHESAILSSTRADSLLKSYVKARDSALEGLYARISDKFVDFYGVLHEHEKTHFTAELQPQRASLRFEVDFMGRGIHPPHALHSEGHQDSMGLCLFLALNQELSKGNPDLIVLDDVMMSVDSGHRKDVCRLLTERFPDSQFVITTHDKTWATQMKQERVVEPDQLIEFSGWSLETGPQTHRQKNLWQTIHDEIERGDINTAAFKLRRGSEGFFESVCDVLGARITYNSNMHWELNDWMFAAMESYTELLRKAKNSASSWNNQQLFEELTELDSVRSQIRGRIFTEQWAINPSVHYNAWENMSKEDFLPVVEVFRDLHGLFECTDCGTLIEKIPRKGSPDIAKCRCSKISWNLRSK